MSFFGFRDPRKVLKGRVDAKINRKVYDAQLAARRKAEGAAKGAAKKAKGGAAPAKPAAAKKKKKMGLWPFGGGKSEEVGEIPACHNCAAEVDPTWPKCPYCGTDLGAASAPPVPNQGPPVPGGGAPPPMVAANKTMAVNIDALTAPKRSVVGWLVVMAGNQKGMDFRLFEGKNSLGAAADNDIVITDEYLSSKHASIRYEGGRYEFIDHDSTNGSFVNEKKVTKEELIDNDTVRVGRTEFRFKALY